MTQQKSYPASAQDAYDAFAPVYDEFNRQNDHELWVGKTLLPELEKHGLQGPAQIGFDAAALDVGCGTGLALPPLLQRGWEVVGVDASAAMLEQASARLASLTSRAWFVDRQRLFVHDARELPRFRQSFSLVLLLNDVVNYLTEDGDLERCFRGVEENLALGGLVCFDVNSLALMRSNFESSSAGLSRGGWRWKGAAEEVVAGGAYEAQLSGPDIEPHVHRQRHWTEEEILEALEAVGLTCLARHGQREEGDRIILSEDPDEERDLKVIYIGGHRGE